MTRQRLLTLVVLGLAVSVVSTLGEAASRRFRVTAEIVQSTFTGDPDRPQLGDRSIFNVDLVDKSGARVGTVGASCTIISVPPLDTSDECLFTAVLAKGQLIFGGVGPAAAVVRAGEVGTTVQRGILGGTGAFRTARGEVSVVVTGPGLFDVTFDVRLD